MNYQNSYNPCNPPISEHCIHACMKLRDKPSLIAQNEEINQIIEMFQGFNIQYEHLARMSYRIDQVPELYRFVENLTLSKSMIESAIRTIRELQDSLRQIRESAYTSSVEYAGQTNSLRDNVNNCKEDATKKLMEKQIHELKHKAAEWQEKTAEVALLEHRLDMLITDLKQRVKAFILSVNVFDARMRSIPISAFSKDPSFQNTTTEDSFKDSLK